MYLNDFAATLDGRDMTASPEFASLLESAADLGIPHAPSVRYRSRHTVVRGQRPALSPLTTAVWRVVPPSLSCTLPGVARLRKPVLTGRD